MPHDSEPKFRRDYTKDQLRGRHHLTLTPASLNEAFLAECDRQRRVPSDMIRIILEDRYIKEVSVDVDVHYPKSVDVNPRSTTKSRKQEVA